MLPPSAFLLHAEEKNSPYKLGLATRDGIGKFYMGREISKVMGHLGA
ncbi:MAG: SAM-dependent methyltransferase, partial [Verrucomicrobia bacterium TMED175]